MKTGIELIAEERQKQIDKFGYTVEYDFEKWGDKGQLVKFASYVLLAHNDMFPEGMDYDKVKQVFHGTTRIQQLSIAGAIVAAQIDVLLKQEQEK